MNAEQQAHAARFDDMLLKIEIRLHELMSEASRHLSPITGKNPTDLASFTIVLSKFDDRVHALRAKIDEEWNGGIGSLFESLDDDGAFFSQGFNKKEDVEQVLDHEWARFKVSATSKFYRNVYAAAALAARTPVACKNCNTQLPIGDRATTVSLKCAQCQTPNEIAGDFAAILFKSGGPQAFAAEEALPIRFEIDRFRIQSKRKSRKLGGVEPSSNIQRWSAMERSYYVRFAFTQAKYAGGPIDYEWIESQMTRFRRQLIGKK